jgi:hypothetical protein
VNNDCGGERAKGADKACSRVYDPTKPYESIKLSGANTQTPMGAKIVSVGVFYKI